VISLKLAYWKPLSLRIMMQWETCFYHDLLL